MKRRACSYERTKIALLGRAKAWSTGLCGEMEEDSLLPCTIEALGSPNLYHTGAGVVRLTYLIFINSILRACHLLAYVVACLNAPCSSALQQHI